MLLSAGAASGVSAGFNAPLAGVFFALEIIQPKLKNEFLGEKAGISAVLLASVVSGLVAR